MPKNPERQLAGRLGHAVAYSHIGGMQMTEAARRAGPGRLAYWLEQQPADLTEPDRVKRAEAAKRAHFLKLAHSSVMARRRNKASA